VFAWRAFRRLAEQTNENNRRLLVLLDRNNQVIERNSQALGDLQDEVRANTQAILRLLDRLDGGAEPA
jgi:hypothetical protein